MVVTLLNVSVFVVLVFEYQLNLIAENAILTSQHSGSYYGGTLSVFLEQEN